MNTKTLTLADFSIEVRRENAKRDLVARIDRAYASDTVKTAWTPFGLCEEMLSSIEDLSGEILVLSDLGFIPVLIKRGVQRDQIRFVAHTAEQAFEANQMGVSRIISIGYNDPIKELEAALVGLKFDIVVGNPPYQDSSEKSHSNSLWVKFIGVSVDHLKADGILSLVVPATWAGGDLHRKVKGRQLTVTSLRSKVFSEGSFSYVALGEPVTSHFNVGVEFSAFVWRRGSKTNTKLRTSGGELEVDTSSMRWIPIVCTTQHLSILNKVLWSSNHKKITLLQHNSQNGDVRNSNIGHGSFELYNTSAQWKSGKRVFSTIDCPHREKKKVVYSDSGYAAPMFDDGKLGLCHHGRAIEVETEDHAKNLIAFLDSKLVKFLTKTKAASGLAVGFTLIATTLPELDWNIAWTDERLAVYFSLSEDECRLINES